MQVHVSLFIPGDLNSMMSCIRYSIFAGMQCGDETAGRESDDDDDSGTFEMIVMRDVMSK